MQVRKNFNYYTIYRWTKNYQKVIIVNECVFNNCNIIHFYICFHRCKLLSTKKMNLNTVNQIFTKRPSIESDNFVVTARGT